MGKFEIEMNRMKGEIDALKVGVSTGEILVPQLHLGQASLKT